MNVRHTKIEDIPRLQEIFTIAKQFMRSTGNMNQWTEKDYPGGILNRDIENGVSYVIEDDGRIVGTFAFIIGPDPTYDVIEDGSWLDDEKLYGTIHRIASDGSRRQILEEALKYCFDKVDNVRIDTHADNKVMQHKVEKNGFTRCGIIYIEDGSPRIAYQKIQKPEEM